MNQFAEAITKAFQDYLSEKISEAVKAATLPLHNRITELEEKLESIEEPEIDDSQVESAVEKYMDNVDFDDYVDTSDIVRDVVDELDLEEQVARALKAIVSDL